MSVDDDQPYRILCGLIVPDELERLVNEHIKSGYEPVGGLHMRVVHDSATFYQAVYRRKAVTINVNTNAPPPSSELARAIGREIERATQVKPSRVPPFRSQAEEEG